MSRLIGEENIAKRVIAIRFRANLGREHAEINENSRVCISCTNLLTTEIQLENDPTCTKLNILRTVGCGGCFICNNNQGTQRLSLKSRVDIFVRRNIYAPSSARCCPHHLHENGNLLRALLPGLQYINRSYRLHGEELLDFLQMLRILATPDEVDFSNINSFSDEEFELISPITKEQFNDMLTFCDDIEDENDGRHRRTITQTDLLSFLCKLRQGLPDAFLKLLFNYPSRQAVSLAVSKVRKSLMLRFVPANIGLNAINRQAYIQQHVTEFSNYLFNDNPDTARVIVIIDGTYSYIEKSSNFQALRQSYCLHKGRHLVKPALLVAPDGYILDIHGPYFSDWRNNDAAILQKEFENDGERLRQWLGENSIIIVDRGYRDVIPLLDQLGINHYMPALLEQGQRQLTTEAANESRLVTKCRWVVEARNGHIKSIFKFFKNIIPYHHVIHLRDFYLIAGAIINRYRRLISMEGATRELAQTMLEKAETANNLQTRVIQENLARRNAIWNTLNHNHILDFPPLTLDYLQDLTIGVYQLNLSPSYIQDALSREGNEELEVDENRHEPGLLRMRVYSRFRNATKYQLWINYRPINANGGDENNEEAILGYYCTCKMGARTLGTCAHIASALWFLGYARHQPFVKYPSTALLDNIADVPDRYEHN